MRNDPAFDAVQHDLSPRNLLVANSLSQNFVTGPKQTSHKKNMRIVLNMIVKNEGRIIQRCLSAAASACRDDAFAVCVCDTGSTDDTIIRIQEWGKASGTPTLVQTHDFVDFAHNRNWAARMAQDFRVSLGWLASETFLLFVDADLVLQRRSDGSDESWDDVDAVFLRQRTADFCDKTEIGASAFTNLRFVRCDVDLVCVGRTHERYVLPCGCRRKLWSRFWIRDFADGGSKSDKYERDLSLLRMDLRDNPYDARALFYMGQTLLDLNRPDEAIPWFCKRVELSEESGDRSGDKKGENNGEVFFSQYRIGMCHAAAQRWEEAIEAFQKAASMAPHRAEPWAARAVAHKRLGQWSRVRVCAKACLAKKSPSPHDDWFLVCEPAYTWWPLLLLSDCAEDESGDSALLDESIRASERLLSPQPGDAAVPRKVEDVARWNLSLARQRLSNATMRT